MQGFSSLQGIADARLVEICPAGPGAETAAFGFALAWTLSSMAADQATLFWAAPEHGFSEIGAPHAEGLAQYGLQLGRLLIAHAKNQADALWAAEQGLTLARASVLCTVAPAPKALSLTATRRLLLAAEKHDSRCVLLRLDRASASAAWLRWSIASAPSIAEARELGPPAFDARLTRNRAGPSGQSWRLEWNAHARAFIASEPAHDRILAGAVAAASADRPPATRRASAV